MKRPTVTGLAVAAILLAGGACYAFFTVRVPRDTIAVVTRGGAAGASWTLAPGLHVRPFGAEVRVYPTGPVTVTGETLATPATGGEMPLRFTVTFRVEPGRAAEMQRALAGRSIEAFGASQAEGLLRQAAARSDLTHLLTAGFRTDTAAEVAEGMRRAGLADAAVALQEPDEDALLAAAQYLGPRREGREIREAVSGALARTASPGWKLLTAAGMVDESDRLLDEAERKYLDALAAEPAALPPMTQLVNLYGIAGQWRKMARILDAALSADPRSVQHINWLAMALVKLDQTDGAEEILKKGLAIDPDNATLLSNLGALCMKANRTEEARVHLTRAVEMSPSNTQALYNLGSALAAVDRFAEALPYLERAEQFGGETPALLRTLAIVHQSLGNTEKAAAYRKRMEEVRAERPVRRTSPPARPAKGAGDGASPRG